MPGRNENMRNKAKPHRRPHGARSASFDDEEEGENRTKRSTAGREFREIECDLVRYLETAHATSMKEFVGCVFAN